MPVKLVYERPEIHRVYNAIKSITVEVDDERTLDEMQEAFDNFLKAMGFHIPLDEDGPYDEPLIFNNVSEDVITLTGMGDMDNIDLYDLGDPITLDLTDMYGATTTKLKDD